MSKIFEQTGERFIPTQSNPFEVTVNLDRYMFAVDYCMDKDTRKGRKVLELGCGSGLGTYLYSLVADSITAIDYSDDAFEYAKQYPFDPKKVLFKQMDLEKEAPEEQFDLTIATEFLEHISDPASLLEKLNTKYLVFSLPLSSLAVSKFHKFPTRDGKEGVEDIKNLIEKSYVIESMSIQHDTWVYGLARKKKSWL